MAVDSPGSLSKSSVSASAEKRTQMMDRIKARGKNQKEEKKEEKKTKKIYFLKSTTGEK